MSRVSLSTTGLALISAVLSLPALADGPPPSAPAPKSVVRQAPAPVARAAPAPNWTGGQFGGHAGGSQLGQSFAEPGANLCPNNGVSSPSYAGCVETPFSFNSHATSFTAGTFLGWRMQFGNIVAGVEGDISWKHASKGASIRTTGVVGPGGFVRGEHFDGSQSQDWDGSFRGRAGLLLTPSVLLYGTAGVAFGEVCGGFAYFSAIDNGASFASARGAGTWCETRVGYTAGGGIEAQLFGPFKGRIEYRFTDLGEFSKNVPLTGTAGGALACGAGGFSCTGNARVDLTDNTFHTLRIGIAVDF